jgi:uncharacterized protein (TIGR02145 family)
MKDLIKILSAVLLVTAINACTLQEVPDPTDGGGAITITAQTVQEQDVTNTPGTKTTLSGVETHWKGVDSYPGNPDKIGIFSPQARTTEGGSDPIKNAEFTAQASAKSSNFTGTMFWGADGNHDFYAYYPRNPEFTGERTVVPVSLASAQSQSEGGNSAHIGALDYMVATPLTVARGGAVNLTFNHVFAMIEFQITGSGSLSAVRLTGTNALACTGTIDLTQTPGVDDIAYTIAQTSTSQTVTVTLGSAASLSTTTAVSVFMMILPGAQSENLQIGVKIDGNWKEMSKTQPSGGFVRGKKYQISVFHDSRDGNLYSYRTYGSQVWMTKNMAYLPSVVGPGTGSNSTAYYYVYRYDGSDVATAKATDNYSTYGVLYNWTAAQSACPSGWHLPSDAEWTTLTTYLGGESVAGGKMKEAGESHWTSPNTGATNESGFTALPGGYRASNGLFRHIGIYGSWWSSTESSTDCAWVRHLNYLSSYVDRNDYNKDYGFSVRCLRD